MDILTRSSFGGPENALVRGCKPTKQPDERSKGGSCRHDQNQGGKTGAHINSARKETDKSSSLQLSTVDADANTLVVRRSNQRRSNVNVSSGPESMMIHRPVDLEDEVLLDSQHGRKTRGAHERRSLSVYAPFLYSSRTTQAPSES